MQKEFKLEKPFNQLRCQDIGTLVLTQGELPSLVVEADETILDVLIVEVRGDSLVLALEEDWFGRIGKVISSIFNTANREVIYHLTVPDLEKISISGKLNLNCESFKTDNLNLRISGIGNSAFTRLECTNLEVIISGRGEFSAAGRADHQSIRISGSGEYEAKHLTSQTARIIISGQGNATLRVADELEITISGLGQVNYIGSPQVRQVISGLGKSKQLNTD